MTNDPVKTLALGQQFCFKMKKPRDSCSNLLTRPIKRIICDLIVEATPVDYVGLLGAHLTAY
jgi:hypothetical protein